MKSLKVLLVGTYPRDQQYSLTGFARALHDGLPAYGLETRLITPAVIAGASKLAGSRAGNWPGHLDKLVFFPRQLRRALPWADVVHLVDHGLAVYVRHLQKTPHLVTCNDLIAMRAARGDIPEWQTAGTAGVFQNMILSGLNSAQHIACISEATRSDLCRLTAVPADRTTVIYDSLFHPYTPLNSAESATHLQKIGVPPERPFLFHIGRNVPTKNRLGVLQIFEAFRRSAMANDFILVMAGKPLSPALRAWIVEHELEDVVAERPHLSNDELRALYSSARALVFPSLCEGFGLPILEAQACGCPVFTSDRAPMTEVGGKAAVYFDPMHPPEAARIIQECLSSPDITRQMVSDGFDNVNRFSPKRMFHDYAELYKCLIKI